MLALVMVVWHVGGPNRRESLVKGGSNQQEQNKNLQKRTTRVRIIVYILWVFRLYSLFIVL